MWKRRFTAELDPAQTMFVVGDIHGRLDLLNLMIQRLVAEAAPEDQIIFIGDYVDRGPNSAGVLRCLQAFQTTRANTKTLLGNHEVMALSFLDDPIGGRRWLRHGGVETLESFGTMNVTENSEDAQIEFAAEVFRAALGPDLITFLKGLELHHSSGNVFVSHAGADPDQSLDAQTERALIWGAPKFRSKPRKDNQWVVHGHYAETAPSAENGRISVDTGAYFSNRLTAAKIEPGQVSFITVDT